MLDAFGRIPHSIAQGNNVDLGSFDECVDIYEHMDSGLIRGRYCYGGLAIPLVDNTYNVSLSKEKVSDSLLQSIDTKNMQQWTCDLIKRHFCLLLVI